VKIVTATELARNFKQMLDLVEFHGEELTVVRNNHQVAKVLPGPARMSALEAMSDLYRTLSDGAAAEWLENSRDSVGVMSDEIQDPWVS
jgi:PHD/YefM family antitoxin component YafN of YafNO toxin-antitoxin module